MCIFFLCTDTHICTFQNHQQPSNPILFLPKLKAIRSTISWHLVLFHKASLIQNGDKLFKWSNMLGNTREIQRKCFSVCNTACLFFLTKNRESEMHLSYSFVSIVHLCDKEQIFASKYYITTSWEAFIEKRLYTCNNYVGYLRAKQEGSYT